MSHAASSMSAESALQKLIAGNERYAAAGAYLGDVSADLRSDTAAHGQQPYAVIITCSDSRVIPEAVFSAGIGDLFVIRVAGNVIDRHQLGSIEYASGHLGTNLIVVMGHTGCGAVDAAMNGEPEGYIRSITDEIRAAAGDAKDAREACVRNALHAVRVIERSLSITEDSALLVVPAIYDIETGRVEFLKKETPAIR